MPHFSGSSWWSIEESFFCVCVCPLFQINIQLDYTKCQRRQHQRRWHVPSTTCGSLLLLALLLWYPKQHPGGIYLQSTNYFTLKGGTGHWKVVLKTPFALLHNVLPTKRYTKQPCNVNKKNISSSVATGKKDSNIPFFTRSHYSGSLRIPRRSKWRVIKDI